MNKLLQLNKKILLLILFAISIIFIFTIIFNNTESPLENITKIETTGNFDIINPSFTINSNKEKISVKAKRGNFISKDVILLENEVIFHSPQFILSSNMVIFNQKKQTAKSSEPSVFQSKGTKISSEGFEITKNGDIILFNGKSILILEK